MDAVLAGSMLVAAISDAALAALTGCFFVQRWLAASVERATLAVLAPSLRRIGLASLLFVALAHAVRPWFVAASMTGSNSLRGNFALYPDILTGTHQGSLWAVSSIGLVLLVGNLLVWLPGRVRSSLTLSGILLVAASKSASGHAANDGDFTLAEFSMFLHILGTAVWAGAIALCGFVVMPRMKQISDSASLWRLGGSLSRTVTWAVVVLLCAGIYTSNRELEGSLAPLWQSAWGRILLLKCGAVLLALLMGALTRFQCLQKPASQQRAARMVRWVRVEAGLMVLIMGLSGVLASTPPASSEATDDRSHGHHH